MDDIQRVFNHAMGRAIKAAAAERGMKVEALGELVGLPKTTFYAKLKSPKGFDSGLILAIARELDMSFMELARRAALIAEHEGADMAGIRIDI